MELITGQLLARRYRLGQRIAVGGMGEVWRATDTRLDRPVAIKVLKPELSGDAEFRRRFHAEARMTASLNHPGIAAVHDYGEAASDPDLAELVDPDLAYLVMELVDGEPLAAVLSRQPRLPVARTLEILQQAGEALQAAHDRGLVHRDIKPANILITPAGGVKLTDFGIARAINAAPVTHHGMVLGTAHYIAPEQAAGAQSGPAGDVYSLAVVGYECLAGRRPFTADSAVSLAMMHIHRQPPPLPPDVPAGVRALIGTSLAKDPRQRYGTGGEFAAAVAAVRAGQPPPPPHGMPVAMAALAPAGPAPAGQASAAGVTTRLGLETRGLVPGHPSPTARLAFPAGLRWPRLRLTPRLGAVLLGACLLALGGYLAREALSPAASTIRGTGPSSTAMAAPAPPVLSEPAVPAPAKSAPVPPLPFVPDQVLPGVLVVPTDYWGHLGSDAVVTAKARGLIPRVVDESGQLVDPDLRSQCRIIGVEPLAGLVPRGSTIELTCRRGK
jgi:serine/threonine-protein kinase